MHLHCICETGICETVMPWHHGVLGLHSGDWSRGWNWSRTWGTRSQNCGLGKLISLHRTYQPAQILSIYELLFTKLHPISSSPTFPQLDLYSSLCSHSLLCLFPPAPVTEPCPHINREMPILQGHLQFQMCWFPAEDSLPW